MSVIETGRENNIILGLFRHFSKFDNHVKTPSECNRSICVPSSMTASMCINETAARMRLQIYAFARLTQYPVRESLCAQCSFKKSRSKGTAVYRSIHWSPNPSDVLLPALRNRDLPVALTRCSGMPVRLFGVGRRISCVLIESSRNAAVSPDGTSRTGNSSDKVRCSRSVVT